jgi:hypothetical protein
MVSLKWRFKHQVVSPLESFAKKPFAEFEDKLLAHLILRHRFIRKVIQHVGALAILVQRRFCQQSHLL